jgi:2-dehydro-3-deoxyphosphogluconate aldolase / (4S)-4-hydroxy-2-oxoglutarate aldolase
MTRTERLIENLKQSQLMVAVRTGNPEDAYHAAAACVEGGIRFVEITFSVPGADEVVRRLCADARVTVGAGTVLSVDEARKALKAGAAYLVSPGFDEEVVRFAKKEGVVSIPGAATPTEIYRAHRAGGDIIKLFPFVELGGLGFLKAIRGPLPFVKYLLCGGATLENVAGYLEAGAAGVLIGSAILRRELVGARDWNAVAEQARSFVRKVEEFERRKQDFPGTPK